MFAEIQKFDARLKSLSRAKHIPALSVALVAEGEIALAEGYGFADLQAGIPAEADTPYLVGSLTKPLAATLFMQLVEDYGLDLDAPMHQYYKSYASFCKQVQGYAAAGIEPRVLFQDYRCKDYEISLRHHLSHTAQGRVGGRFSYNSFLYGISSRVVDAVANCDYATFFTRNIIEALGLESTSPHTSGITMRLLPKPVSTVYYIDPNHKAHRTDYPEATFTASSGLVSTVLDLARFDMALDRGELVSYESREAMWTAYKLRNNGDSPYGLGWYVQPYQDVHLIWHHAWWPDASSSIYLKIPERNLSLILLANSEGLWWDNPRNGDILPSPFVQAFLECFLG